MLRNGLEPSPLLLTEFLRSHYNQGEIVFRVVGYSGSLGSVVINVRAKPEP